MEQSLSPASFESDEVFLRDDSEDERNSDITSLTSYEEEDSLKSFGSKKGQKLVRRSIVIKTDSDRRRRMLQLPDPYIG